MTTYRTGNAIGSADPRDLYDNAENLDELVNSQDKAEHPDRLGVSRKTWHGMESEHQADQTRREGEFQAAQADKQQRFNLFLANSGYQFSGEYASGIELTEYNQVLRDGSGNLWRISAATSLPYTTDGNGMPEGDAFVPVGDNDLRSDLINEPANGQGALLVRGAVIYVNTITDLQSLDTSELVDGQQVQAKEYHAGTGIGGGQMYYDRNRATENDGGTVFNGFVRIIPGYVTPLMFGGHDDSAIMAAADYCRSSGLKLFGPAIGKSYKLYSPIDLRGILDIEFQERIDTSEVVGEIPVQIGGFSSRVGGKWRFNDITNGDDLLVGPITDTPVLRIWGAKSPEVHLGSCQYVQVYADSAEPGCGSTAYGKYYLAGVQRKLELTDSGAPTSWVNENKFYADRLQKLRIASVGYAHNHNIIERGAFEGEDVEIRFEGGVHQNRIYNARFEGVSTSPGIYFSPTSYSNYVVRSWSGVGYPRPEFTALGIPVEDHGLGNRVHHDALQNSVACQILNVTPSNTIQLASGTQTTSNYRGFIPDQPRSFSGEATTGSAGATAPGVCTLRLTGGGRAVYESEYIPVMKGDVFEFECDTPCSYRIYFFDENRRPIVVDAGDMVRSVPFTFSTTANGLGRVSSGTVPGGNSTVAALNDESVKYVRLEITSTAPGMVESLRVTMYVPMVGRRGLVFSSGSKELALASAPTRGIAPAYTRVLDRNGGPGWLCTFEFRGHLTTSSSGSSITINDNSGIASGDVIGIDLDDGSTHWTSVGSISGSTVSLTDALPSLASSGNPVGINRWTEAQS